MDHRRPVQKPPAVADRIHAVGKHHFLEVGSIMGGFRTFRLKHTVWVLAVVLAMLAVACGDDIEPASATAAPVTTAPPTAATPVSEPEPTATAEPERTAAVTTAAVTPTAEPEPTATAAPTAEPEPTAVPSEEKEDETKVSGPAAIGVASNPALGDMLVDSEGLTLYLFTVDERNKSNCTGGCATTWPPLLTIGDPTAGEGVSADHLGTLERDDGSTQVTYNGRPLYYFSFDNAPGDANGQDSRDVWYVVSPFGGPVQSNALVNVAAHNTVGTVLADRSGRTQYLFTPDNRGVSNCTGGCAMFWPPLLTIGDPTAGEGVSADHLGTLDRDDGSTQVTYNGWPIYYFAFDNAPGDANGQASRDVWYVISNQTPLSIALGELNDSGQTGSCGDTLGDISHGLTSFVDGAGKSITVIGATLDSLRTGDFAINAHHAGSPGTYTACGNIPELSLPPPPPVTVDANIQGFRHVDLTVQLGTTVKWTNRDGPSHTVTVGSNGAWDGTGFDSGSVSQGQTFEFAFDTLGTFAYTCKIHPSMNATITVQ